MRDPLRDLTLGLAFALMAGWLLHVGRPVFAPVVVAALIVYAILGLAQMAGRVAFAGRALPEGARILLAAALMLLGLVEFGGLLIASLGDLAARGPALQQAAEQAAARMAELVGVSADTGWAALRQAALAELDLPRLLRRLAGEAAALAGALFIVVLNLVFLLVERRTLRAKLGLMADDPARAARLGAVVDEMNARIGRYLAIKTLMCGLVGALSWATMAALGVEFAAFWALVIALLNYIPYVGTPIGIAFPALLTLAGGDVGATLMLVAALLAIQTAIGNVFEPFAMGGSLNLSPWAILVALMAWSALWGVLGALISVPVTAMLMVVLAEFRGTRPIAILLSKDGRLDPRD